MRRVIASIKASETLGWRVCIVFVVRFHAVAPLCVQRTRWNSDIAVKNAEQCTGIRRKEASAPSAYCTPPEPTGHACMHATPRQVNPSDSVLMLLTMFLLLAVLVFLPYCSPYDEVHRNNIYICRLFKNSCSYIKEEKHY